MRNCFESRIDFICLLIGLVITKVIAIDHPWDAITNINYTTCETYKCRTRAQYMERSLDISVNPCKDFYQYSCGRWLKDHPIPTTEVEFSIETYLKQVTMKRVKYLLEMGNYPGEHKDAKAAKKLYRECMKRPLVGRLGAGVVKFHINKAGNWPICSADEHIVPTVTSWTKLLEYYIGISGIMPLFDINVGVTEKKVPIIQVEEVLEPFVMLDVVKWTKKKEDLYIKFLKQIIKSLGIFQSNCELDTRIREVIRFRQKLDQVHEYMSETDVESIQSVRIVTIKQFQEWYTNQVASLRSRAQIPWLRIIEMAFPSINGEKVDENTKISLVNPEYFELLAKLLDKTPRRVIENHINFFFVEGHLKLNPKLVKLLKEIIFNDELFYDDLIIDVDKLRLCVTENPMQEAIANMYNEVYLTKDIEKDVLALADDIKEMLKVHMSESQWLHSSMKYKIGQKITRTGTFIGFKDVTNEVLKRPYLHNKQYLTTKMIPYIIPEATYVLQNEHILIGTGYLQQPIYDKDMPFVLNYGSLGALLGHEYFHSFQSGLSKKYNRSIKKEENITSELYTRKTECFVNHYNQFEVKEFLNIPFNRYVKPDMLRSVDENIADTMGLKAAFEAYRRKLLNDNKVCHIPSFHMKWTCDQVFFISFALTFCGNIPTTEVRKMLTHLTHLPPGIRVNGAVSNLEAFSDAFNCPKKSFLNPKKKCDIWT